MALNPVIILHELRDKFLDFQPLEKKIDQILNLGDRFSARFTFFVTTEYVNKRNDHILRKIDKSGHEIASHSHKHISFAKISRKKARYQIARSLQKLQRYSRICGFRAPYLVSNEQSDQACRDCGLVYTSSDPGKKAFYNRGLWKIPVTRPMDYQVIQSEGIVDTLCIGKAWKSFAGPGQVLLFHPWRIGSRRYVNFLEQILRMPLRFGAIEDFIDDRSLCCITFDLDFLETKQVYFHTLKHLYRSPHLNLNRGER